MLAEIFHNRSSISSVGEMQEYENNFALSFCGPKAAF